jgi:hypothetical protein
MNSDVTRESKCLVPQLDERIIAESSTIDSNHLPE